MLMNVIINFLFYFQTNMISLEALPKIIDTTQLTSDLEGTLHYDHSQWIDMRLVSNVRFKFCMVMIQVMVFWVMTPCSDVV